MIDKLVMDKLIFDESLKQQDLNQSDKDFLLTEIDLYPPSDNRILKSYIEDIDGGDNFADFCEEFFEMLEEEGYYD